MVNMRAYRAKHRRLDYYPSPAALEAIARHRHISNCVAGVLDYLIEAGNRAIAGKRAG